MGKLINGIWVDWIEKVKILQKVAIQNEEGLFLAVKRSDSEHTRAGKWDLVGGSLDVEDIENGKIGSGMGDDQDILIKALKREITEETQLTTKMGSTRVVHTASGYNDQKNIFILAIGYIAKVDSDQIVKVSKEHSEYKWVTLEEFKKLDIGDDGGLTLSILEKINGN